VLSELSDYEGEDGYTTAHVDIRSSRSARDFGRASGMLHTEEVTGSNPVSPTVVVFLAHEDFLSAHPHACDRRATKEGAAGEACGVRVRHMAGRALSDPRGARPDAQTLNLTTL
jgi:hypothetical protein